MKTLSHFLTFFCINICMTTLLVAQSSQLIWMEAESAESSNIPPITDAFLHSINSRENNPLSGGDWVGFKCDNSDTTQYTLRYRFEITEVGKYHLYARKLTDSHGFRWRINNSEWINANEDYDLDSIRLFPNTNTMDSLNLSWCDAGNIFLGKGSHTLYVEPQSQKNTHTQNLFKYVAYDAFVFTPDLFHPKGKIKPGATYSITNKSHFSFEPPVDSFKDKVSYPASLNEPSAGAKGRIVIQQGKLHNEGNPESLKLVGVTVPAHKLTSKQHTEYLAASLKKRNINLVRCDIAPFTDFSKSEPLQLEPLKKLLEAIQIFRDHGIYIALYFDIKHSAGLNALCPNKDNISSFLLFHKPFQYALKNVWKQLLETQLPDATSLKDEPSVAMITLFADESIFASSFKPYATLPPDLTERIESEFASWLIQRYKSLDAIFTAWGKKSKLPHDFPEASRIALMDMETLADAQSERSRDTALFLAEIQKAFYEHHIRFLKEELGYKGLVTASNCLTHAPETLGYLNAWSQNAGDFFEKQGYYKTHYTTHASNDGNSALYSDRSALRLNPYSAELPSWLRYELPLKNISYGSKPTWISSINWATPNRFRGEAIFLTATLSAIQGIDAFSLNMMPSTNWQTYIDNSQSTTIFTSAIMGQMPAITYAFRKGYLPKMRPIATIHLPKDKLSHSGLPLYEREYSSLTQAPSNSRKPATDEMHPGAWLAGKITVQLDAPNYRFDILEVPNITHNRIDIPDAGIHWDYEKGILTLERPFFHAVAGFFAQAKPIQLKAFNFESNMEYGIVCLVSLDNQPLNVSKKMLLQVYSEEHNSNWTPEGETNRQIKNFGNDPVLTKNLQGTLLFSRPDADELIVTALDENGYKQLTCSIGKTLTCLPATLYYLIEKDAQSCVSKF